MAYSCWFLPENERSKLLSLIPPVYPDVVAHHITSELGSFNLLQTPREVKAEIIGFSDNGEGVQAMVVRIDGTTDRPIGGTYHITWSLDRAKGFSPVDSNKVIEELGWIPFVLPILLVVEPRIFK